MSRIVYIDYLRNFANITRCLIHASVPYMVTIAPIWPVDDNGIWFFDFTVFVSHLFVMELFFMISGFIFAINLRKHTIGTIIKNRFNRIVIPFVLGLIIIIPIVLSLFSLSNHIGFTFLDKDILKQSYINGWNKGFDNFFPTAHLWFLYYLIIFYIITLLLKKLIFKIRVNSIFLLVFISILISAISMFFMKRWVVDNPLTLVPEIPTLVHYYLFFILGILANNTPLLMNDIKQKSKYLLRGGLFLGLVAIVPQLWFENSELEYYLLIKLAAIFLSCFAIYFLVFGLWGYFIRLKLKDSKVLRYVTDSSYWVYISNTPIVVIIQIILIAYDIPVFLKFMISFFGAFTISMFFYEYCVRYTIVGRILNKSRKRKKKTY